MLAACTASPVAVEPARGLPASAPASRSQLLYVTAIDGSGFIYTDQGREPSSQGDVIFTPRGHWHGFDNTGKEDVVLVWGWSGAGSLEAAGYEIPQEG